MKTLGAIRRSSGLLRFYVVAVVVASILSEGWITLGAAIIILGLTVIAEVLLVTWVELKQVHRQVDGQTEEMLRRIDTLAQILRDHGIHPPQESEKVSEARFDSRSDA